VSSAASRRAGSKNRSGLIVQRRPIVLCQCDSKAIGSAIREGQTQPESPCSTARNRLLACPGAQVVTTSRHRHYAVRQAGRPRPSSGPRQRRARSPSRTTRASRVGRARKGLQGSHRRAHRKGTGGKVTSSPNCRRRGVKDRVQGGRGPVTPRGSSRHLRHQRRRRWAPVPRWRRRGTADRSSSSARRPARGQTGASRRGPKIYPTRAAVPRAVSARENRRGDRQALRGREEEKVTGRTVLTHPDGCFLKKPRQGRRRKRNRRLK